MAKGIVKQASKDDPIYTGRFIIFSPNKRPPVRSDKSDDEEMFHSLLPFIPALYLSNFLLLRFSTFSRINI